jgi:hypothetical protein
MASRHRAVRVRLARTRGAGPGHHSHPAVLAQPLYGDHAVRLGTVRTALVWRCRPVRNLRVDDGEDVAVGTRQRRSDPAPITPGKPRHLQTPTRHGDLPRRPHRIYRLRRIFQLQPLGFAGPKTAFCPPSLSAPSACWASLPSCSPAIRPPACWQVGSPTAQDARCPGNSSTAWYP